MDTQQNFNSNLAFPWQLNIDDQLIEAVRSQDLLKIKQLIDSGAKVNYIQQKQHGESIYRSTQTSVLYQAVHAKFDNQGQNYVNIIEYLLQKGADPSFKCRVNKWTRCQQVPLLRNFAFTLTKIKEQKLVTKLLNIMASYGVDLNEPKDYRSNKIVKDYRSHHCLAMELAQYCSLPSRIKHLKTKFRPFDIGLLQQQLEKNIVLQFDEQHKTDLVKQYYQSQQQYLQQQQQQQINNKQKSNLLPIQIINELLDLGVCADSYSEKKCNREIGSDEDACSEEDQDSNEDQSDNDSDSENSNNRKRKRRYRSKSRNRRKYKYNMHSTTTRQNLLHRAIMNNSTQMVQLLVRKGADVSEQCKFTVQIPIYPHEWKQKYRQRLIENNIRQLKKKQNQKQEFEADLKQTTDPQKISTLKQCIVETDFKIYELQHFAIQNCCPLTKYKIVRLDCVELAQSMGACAEIIHMLKNAKEIYEQQRRRKKEMIKELKQRAHGMEQRVQQDKQKQSEEKSIMQQSNQQ